MSEDEKKNLNFLKLEGDRVKDGNVTIDDVRAMLDGVEKSAKYFINAKYPELAKKDYDIEVRVESGSLIIWLLGIPGVVITTYLATTAKELAKNDIGDKTTKEVSQEIINNAVKGMKATARIAKHVGAMGKRSFSPEEAKVKDKDTIILRSSDGTELAVSKSDLDTYTKAPKDIFKKLVSGVDDRTKLYIGEPGDTMHSASTVTVDNVAKSIFRPPEDESNSIVFPEWQHGEYRTLLGKLTKANTGTGTLGFAYGGHIVTSYLHDIEIRNIKDSLFDKEVEIEAKVIRTQKKLDAEDDLKKPKLEIYKVTTIGELDDDQQAALFELDREQ